MVTVDVVGEGEREIDLATLDAAEPTYADLLAVVGYSRHEVSVLVDGTPVPEDQPVDADHVRVLRLVQGGCGPLSYRTARFSPSSD
jgi:sulfur carrier protein